MNSHQNLVLALAVFGVASTATFAADRFYIPVPFNQQSDRIQTDTAGVVEGAATEQSFKAVRPATTDLIFLKRALSALDPLFSRAKDYAIALDQCVPSSPEYSEALESAQRLEDDGILEAIRLGRSADFHSDAGDLLDELEALTATLQEYSQGLSDYANLCADLKSAERIVSESLPRDLGATVRQSVRATLLEERNRLSVMLVNGKAIFTIDPDGQFDRLSTLLDHANGYDEAVDFFLRKPAARFSLLRDELKSIGQAIDVLNTEGDSESFRHLSGELQKIKKNLSEIEKISSVRIKNPQPLIKNLLDLGTRKAFVTRVLRDRARTSRE